MIYIYICMLWFSLSWRLATDLLWRVYEALGHGPIHTVFASPFENISYIP